MVYMSSLAPTERPALEPVSRRPPTRVQIRKCARYCKSGKYYWDGYYFVCGEKKMDSDETAYVGCKSNRTYEAGRKCWTEMSRQGGKGQLCPTLWRQAV